MSRTRLRPTRLLWPLLVALLLLACGRLLTDRALAAPAALDPALGDLPPQTPVRLLLHLRAAGDMVDLRAPNRAALVAALHAAADGRQHRLRGDLAALQAEGRIRRVRPLWIVNAIAVETTVAELPQLRLHPDIARISLDAAIPLEQLDLPTGVPLTATSAAPAWGVAQIGAPYVWHGLGITGTGVTVAIVDSGVAWQHPDLRAGYRGVQADGSVRHAGHWYDATDEAIAEPTDLIGHGTHVAATAVGANGSGVAPGARWIAVRIFDSSGLAYSSTILRAFEWLLAPGGNPALAPDIVNNSWGNPNPLTELLPAVEMLRLAGILPVFSAGNNGPFNGTVGVPAAYTDTLAVGASDFDDRVAWFSSRGPSLLTTQPRPVLVAPGTRIVSAVPGGGHADASGTSMAAPHVSGAAALLLAAARDLTPPQLTAILTATTRAISNTHPNNVAGWGRLDVAAAVQHVVAPPPVRMTVRGSTGALAGAALTLTTPAGYDLVYHSDSTGRADAALRPGRYTLRVQAFGYAARQLALTVGSTPLPLIIDLTPLATAPLVGRVFDAAGRPLSATVRVVGTPVQTQADARGRYALRLPPGRYSLHISAPRHALAIESIVLPAGGAAHSVRLAAAPRVLLVDNAAWQYASAAAGYRAALNAIGIAPDEWATRNPLFGTAGGAPALSDLQAYDVVVWADPYGSPGQVGAGRVISQYLDAGGRLLVSGQNVATIDGDGSLRLQQWWHVHLRGRLLGLTEAVSATVRGTAAEFAGLTLQFNGLDSADNQRTLAQVALQPDALGEALLFHADGTAAALGAGLCQPYRLLYFGFGVEGVRGAANRSALLAAGLRYLDRPPNPAGLRFRNVPRDELVVPGRRITQTLRLTNVSETTTETLRLNVDSPWPTRLVSPTLTLGPCRSAVVTLTLEVPADAARAATFTTTLHATGDAGVRADVALQHRVPGYVLFVDDDRWYNNEAVYLTELRRLGVPHDVWTTGWNTGVFADGRGSPPQAILDLYDMVFWYTGADWFAPVTPAELAALTGYMQQGGRLFLSSQDYLNFHADAALTRDYLGVLAHARELTPTQAFGDPDAGAAADWGGPQALAFRDYGNYGDGILPGPAGRVAAWQSSGWPGALATAGDGWRSVFWSMALEALPPAAAADAFGAAVGWLSDLGDTTFAVDRADSAPGAMRHFTLTLRNWPQAPPNAVAVTLTLPAGLTLDAASLRGGARYLPATRQIVWAGTLPGGGTHTLSYRAAAGDVAGELTTTADIWYARHQMRFTRRAGVQVGRPALQASTLGAQAGRLGEPTIYQLRVHNGGAAGAVAVRLFLPQGFDVLTETVSAPPGELEIFGRSIIWRGDIAAGAQISVQAAISTTPATAARWAPAVAVLDNGGNWPLVRAVQPLLAPPGQQFLPMVAQPPAGER